MRILLILIFIWIVGLIFLWPKNGELDQYVGQKISEIQEQLVVTEPPAEKVLDQNTEQTQVIKVVDGDTFEITGGVKVRLIGVNTPETVDPRRPAQCFGKEASNFTKHLLEGQSVRLEKDVSQTDKYGRLLRYVYVKNVDGTETFVNLKLVAEGYAESSSFPPDVKHQNDFLEAQNKAVLDQKGLWGACGSIPHSSSTKK